jgi:gentisate 1,2-dioxygenase
MAQVVDSTEQYYESLKGLGVAPLWRLAEANQTAQPPPCAPHVWRWRELYPRLQQATEVVDLESGAERRVLTMVNPGLRGMAGATHTLTASLQMILPGEIAPAHRHTMAALRFIIQGEGGYTVVEGEKVRMGRGDLILTPGWTWHDHGDEGADPVVWFDGLDAPFVRSLGAGFYQDYPGRRPQVLRKPDEDSVARYGGGTVVPARNRPATLYSPLNSYKWDQAYAALQRLQAADQDDHNGAVLEYVNPVTGGHVLPTLACFLHGLRPGAHTQAHRHTSSSVYFVVSGSGQTIVNGQPLAWEQNDIFAVPPWMWHEHVAHGSGEAVLFELSDLPVIEPFGLYREEAYKDDDGHQRIIDSAGAPQ